MRSKKSVQLQKVQAYNIYIKKMKEFIDLCLNSAKLSTKLVAKISMWAW